MKTVNKKVCMLGEFAVGKTSLVRRFVHERFDDKYLSTIGVKVSRKSVILLQDGTPTELTMMLWDLAGSEEFTQLRTSYLRGSMGAVLVCDLTRPDTLAKLQGYVDTLQAINLRIPVVIAANKCDLIEEIALSENEIDAMAGTLGVPYFLTSAKEGNAVESLFRELGRQMLDRTP